MGSQGGAHQLSRGGRGEAKMGRDEVNARAILGIGPVTSRRLQETLGRERIGGP